MAMTNPHHPPNFEPITTLDDHAFVFAQKGDNSRPVLWIHARANPYSVAGALRLIADEVESAADEDGGYSDTDRAAGLSYARRAQSQNVPPALRGRNKK